MDPLPAPPRNDDPAEPDRDVRESSAAGGIPRGGAAQDAPGLTVDELLRTITPVVWVTPAIAVLILIGFAVEIALGVSVTSPTGTQLLKVGGQFGPAFVDGEWWRLLSSMFLHSGPIHLAFNLWAFWSVGHVTERVYGNRSFIAIYFLSGVAASLTSVAWSPLTVGVGASGAIFGVYGALLAFAVLHRGVFPTEYLAQQRNSIVGFIGYNVIFGLTQKNTDMAAHAGGLVAGALVGSLLARDVLRPAENAGRRLLFTAGLAAALVLAAFGVRSRTMKVPAIEAQREADAAFADLQAERYAEAVEHYTAALAIERELQFFFNRSIAHFSLGNFEAALADLREAHRMAPSAKTHGMLCEVGIRLEAGAESDASYETSQALEEATNHCSEAIRGTDDPVQKSSLLSLQSFARKLQNRIDEAHADADAALTLDEHNAGARANRISLHLAEKKLAEAQQDCTILLAEPEARAVDFALCARVSHALQDRVEERARLDRLLTLTPTHVSALLARAWLNEQENRLADGLADYAKVLELEPESGLAWNNRAWIRIELGEYAAARADADRAVDLEPDSAAARGTRCFALAGLGELEAARSDCVRALELRPTLVDRGMLAFIDERYADARRDWETASEADPAQARQLRPWLAKLPAR